MRRPVWYSADAYVGATWLGGCTQKGCPSKIGAALKLAYPAATVVKVRVDGEPVAVWEWKK
jgi:hypothetical protein